MQLDLRRRGGRCGQLRRRGAQAFKAQALAAAAGPRLRLGPNETFRTGIMTYPPVAADLVPAS
jgi:hypothetical protein